MRSGRTRRPLRLLFALPAVSLALVLAVACSGEGGEAGGPRSTILMVGDGMGAAQREAIRLSTVGLEGQLNMNSLPYSGLSHTSSASEKFVTDSAAAATAMATGVKTSNGHAGVDADEKGVETILEKAREAGKSTGLVTTSSVTDGTLAGFAAHVEDRSEHPEIARQYVEESRPDVILGGGEDFWYPEGEPGAHPVDPREEEDDEEDPRPEENLVEKAEGQGYEYATDAGELEGAEGPKVLGLFANKQMYRADQEDDDDASYDPEVPLPEMAAKAIELLSRNDEGFFLLVEEEAIDSMSHRNNAELMLEAGREFDEAVGVAKDYAEKNPETLLIVASDHETGGLSIEIPGQDEDDGGESDDRRSEEDGPFPVAGPSDGEFSMDWTTTEHTGAAVPITAMGPGAELLNGTYENTHLHEVMESSLLEGR